MAEQNFEQGLVIFLKKMWGWYLQLSSKDVWPVLVFFALLYVNSATGKTLAIYSTPNWCKLRGMSRLYYFAS